MGLDLRCPAAGLQDIPGQGGQSSLSAAGQIKLTIPRGLVRRHAQRRGCCQVVWSTAVLGCGKASHGEVGQGAMVCSVT